MTLVEPAMKRAVAFIDGQNLFHHSRKAFGYHFPNYDIQKLCQCVAKMRGWNLTCVHFYTGVPDAADDPRWNRFWGNKLREMGRQGMQLFSRPLRYRNKSVTLPDGSQYTFLHGEEKGIDVRIALDVIGKAVRGDYDVAVVFSQDQDLSEVADEIRAISKQQNRWIKMACAYPLSPTVSNRRGINGTDWIKISKTDYDACIDPRDYR
jgi:uncharacterized LabA/DUF88 family protein